MSPLLALASGRPMFLAFASILFVLSIGLHYYLWKRLVVATHLEPHARLLRGVLLGAGSLLPVAIGASRLPGLAGPAFGWMAYVWMGWVFLAFSALVASEVVRPLAARLAAALDPDTPDAARRQWIGSSLAVGAAIGATGFSARGVANATTTPRVRHVGIPIPNLPDAFRGWRIAQLTDIHVGPTIGRGFVETVVGETNQLDVDAVAITGDLVDGSVERLGFDVAPLGDLRAPDGVFFVTGNHEYYSGAAAWCDHLPTLGIRVLRNENVAVRRGNSAIRVVGIDDHKAAQFGGGHGADVQRATEGVPASEPMLLLAHQPVQVRDAVRCGVAAQISGHTHGGQIQPFGLLVPLQQPYTRGLHRHADPADPSERTWIYVSCGTGYWGPPMRIGAPPEITVIELLGPDEAPFERDERPPARA